MNIEYRGVNQIRRNKDDNRTTVVINSDALDTYGTVIDPEGVDLSGYMKNPVVLINHNPDKPIGTSNVRLQDGRLIADMGDDDWDNEDEDAMLWRGKVKKGIVRMASIGFRYKDKDMMEDQDENGNKFFRITKSTLMEWSWVTMGANPEAMVLSRNYKAFEADVHERLDKIEERIGKLADRSFIEELVATSKPEESGVAMPAKEEPARSNPAYDPAQLTQMITQTIKKQLGKI